MALNLDPAVLDFIRRKQGLPAEPKLGLDFDWGGDPADPMPAPSQPVAAAPPLDPFADESKAVAELEAIDAEKKRSNALGYLGQTLSRAGSMVRGDKVGPLPAPPQVDDSVRKFILTRKLGAGAAVDPLLDLKRRKLAAEVANAEGGGGDDSPAPAEWGARPGMTRGEALRAGYGHAPKQEKQGKTPITPANDKALRDKGIDPTGMDNDDAARLLGTQLVAGAGLGVRTGEIDRDKDKDSRLGRHLTLGPRSPLVGDQGWKQKTLNAVEATTDLATGSDKLEALIDSAKGAGRLNDKGVRTQMKQLVANLRTALKTIMELGVIAGPDMPQFVDPQIADPTEWEAHFNNWFGELGKTDYKTQLKGLRANFLGKTKRKLDLLDVNVDGPVKSQIAAARAEELALEGKSKDEIKAILRAEGY